MACGQPSAPTMARGHGRCAAMVSMCGMLSSKAMALSQQLRDILEALDQSRRHVNPDDEHNGEMGKHRHVGGLRRRGRPARFAERDGSKSYAQGAAHG